LFHVTENDPLQRQPRYNKKLKNIGWEAKVNRAEGMKITISSHYQRRTFKRRQGFQ
jgi:hypothetical protein